MELFFSSLLGKIFALGFTYLVGGLTWPAVWGWVRSKLPGGNSNG